jgi:hypothetical protein
LAAEVIAAELQLDQGRGQPCRHAVRETDEQRRCRLIVEAGGHAQVMAAFEVDVGDGLIGRRSCLLVMADRR